MATLENKSIIYREIPDGLPTSTHLSLESSTIPASAPAGGLLLQTLYLSLDPYLRGRMRDPETKTYSEAYVLGEPLSNFGISRVLDVSSTGAAAASGLKKGDLVGSPFAKTQFRLYQPVPEEQVAHYAKIEEKAGVPLTYFLGILGMPGMTAYHGLVNVGGPLKAGETLLVSAASGAVGQIVGQLGKQFGMRVVGSVGSDEKVKYVTEELGFDAAWNYNAEKDPYAAIDKYIPEGIDVYFDNVGGPLADAVFLKAKVNGRIVVCGTISQYNTPREQQYGMKNYMEVFQRRLTIKGFIILDTMINEPGTIQSIVGSVAGMVGEGKIKFKEDVVEGIENTVSAFQGLLTGKNNGKLVLKYSD
ncbi:hypothetical protein BZA70DRAFT_286772 [Myxozyma melibiosi]|uniref:Enoyl reductase (ER) domain-containing protein n=1 Tax=Myxozyma melibiosi TaxID=54550 RepID=A0ABR1FC57_9ASCO